MSSSNIGTPAQLRDPNYTPPLGQAIPLGIQHVLAMFVSNFTPAIIVAGAAGFAFGSDDRTYLIQMAMLFAGIATLLQTVSLGPIGAKLPIVQGTSFAFVPVMIPIAAGAGMGALMTSIVICGIFHMILGTFIGRIRHWLPPLVTGLIVLMIGLYLMKVGIEYAAGGAGDFNRGKPTWGGGANWFVAFVVIAVTLLLKFFTKGMWSLAAVLLGLVAGYLVAALMGMVSLGAMSSAEWFALPSPFKYGFDFNLAAIIAMCLIAVVSAIETVGDTSGITKGGADREATNEEVAGATYADGLGTLVGGFFGGLPNTSFSQNVGLVSMTGVMSRGVVTCGAIFLIICGLIPKVGALISSMPLPVLGGGVIIMFGMVAAAGARMLSDVNWNQRNMLIFATALSVGLGLQLVPDALQFLDQKGTLKLLATTGLLPAALIAIVLNLLLPENLDGDDPDHETQLSGLGNTGTAGASAGAGLTAASNVSDSISDGTAGAKLAGGAAAAVAAGGAAVASGMNKVADVTESAGSKTASLVSSTGSSAASAANTTAKKASTKAKSSTGKTKTAAKKTATKAKSAAKSTKAASKSAAKSTRSATKSAASSTRKAASSVRKTAAKTSGKLAKGAGSAIDNLEFVDGIGPKTAKSLQSAGVKNLSGLVAMADSKLEAAAQKAGTGGRPESENWKKQARDILGGKPPQAKSDRAAWERARKKG